MDPRGIPGEKIKNNSCEISERGEQKNKEGEAGEEIPVKSRCRTLLR